MVTVELHHGDLPQHLAAKAATVVDLGDGTDDVQPGEWSPMRTRLEAGVSVTITDDVLVVLDAIGDPCATFAAGTWDRYRVGAGAWQAGQAE